MSSDWKPSSFEKRLDRLAHGEIDRLADDAHFRHDLWPPQGHDLRQVIYGVRDNLLESSMALTAYYRLEAKELDCQLQLGIYGFFQALIVQQDAVRALREFSGLNCSPWDVKTLKTIRETRNMIVGHPTPEKARNSGRARNRAFGSYVHFAMTTKEFLSFTHAGPHEVRTLEIAERQFRVLVPVIEHACSRIRAKWATVFDKWR